jgi:hypothetical protein
MLWWRAGELGSYLHEVEPLLLGQVPVLEPQAQPAGDLMRRHSKLIPGGPHRAVGRGEAVLGRQLAVIVGRAGAANVLAVEGVEDGLDALKAVPGLRGEGVVEHVVLEVARVTRGVGGVPCIRVDLDVSTLHSGLAANPLFSEVLAVIAAQWLLLPGFSHGLPGFHRFICT